MKGCTGTRIGMLLALLLVWAPLKAEEPDPLEPMNRAVFEFNDTLDRWVLKPVAQGYVRVTPDPVQDGVSNFFANLRQPGDGVNHLLQGEFRQAGHSGGRFLINTTIGILGFLDVASHWGLEDKQTDFGLTLGTWGVPGESYLMVPFLGPYTVRGAAGIPVDNYTWPPSHLLHGRDYWGMVAAWGIDKRAGLLDQEDLIVGDRYSFIRDAYLQHRRFQLTGELPEDDF